MDEQIARSTRGEGGEDTTTLSSLVGAVVEVVVVFVVVGAVVFVVVIGAVSLKSLSNFPR